MILWFVRLWTHIKEQWRDDEEAYYAERREELRRQLIAKRTQ